MLQLCRSVQLLWLQVTMYRCSESQYRRTWDFESRRGACLQDLHSLLLLASSTASYPEVTWWRISGNARPRFRDITRRLLQYCLCRIAEDYHWQSCNECSTPPPVLSVTHGSLTAVCPHYSTMSFIGWTCQKEIPRLQAGRHGVSLSARSSTSVPRWPSHSSLWRRFPALLRLRSANRQQLLISRCRLDTYGGRRAFTTASPTAWNSLPDELKDVARSSDSFKQFVKTVMLSFTVQRCNTTQSAVMLQKVVCLSVCLSVICTFDVSQWSVLQADEEMYHSHLQMIESLVQALKTADGQGSGCGAMSSEDITTVLTQFFPLKQSESVVRLVQAAATELNVTSDGLLLYESLFTEVRLEITAPSFT